MRKLVLSAFFIATVLVPLVRTQADTFRDVPSHEWFYPYTEQLAAANIISTSNTYYFPNRSITRAELAKMAVNTAVYQRVVTMSSITTTAFCDVGNGHWAISYIETLANFGAVQGVSAHCTQGRIFSPDNPVTRAEALKMLLGVYHIATTNGTSSFPDVAPGNWFTPYISTAATMGIVNGYSNGTFGPYDHLTRAEMSKMIVKLTEYTSRYPQVINTAPLSSLASNYASTRRTSSHSSSSSSSSYVPSLPTAGSSTITIVVSPTISSSPSATPTPSPTTSSPTPTASTSPSPSSSPSPTASPTPTTSASPTSSATPTASPSPTLSATPTATASPTSTPSSSAFPSGALTFYALGDSLTAGDQDETEMGGYPPRLQTQIAAIRSGSHVVSVGVSGNDSGNVANEQLSATLAAHPHAALVLIGSNDMWNDCMNGDVDWSAGTISAYQTNIHTTLSRLSSANIKIFIGLVDDQSRRPAAPDMCTSAAGLSRMSRLATAFNDIIRSEASTYHATTVDFYNSTIFTSLTTLSIDRNHPNSTGYQAMANLWFSAISPQL